MFYEEKLINGVVCCRSEPDGEWREATTANAKAVNALMALTNTQREDVFRLFCTHCGSTDPGCQCWNDE